MGWILTKYVHANHTAMLFEIHMLTCEGERGSYWLFESIGEHMFQSQHSNWGYKVWRWEVYQRAEASGFIAIWSTAVCLWGLKSLN